MRSCSRRVSVSLLVAACLLLPGAVLAGKDIYRCDVGGRITYTDHGCANQGEATVVAMLPASASMPDFARDRTDSRPIAPGMSPRAVFEALGRPVETIATLQGRTLVEYWLYRGTSGISRVAFQEGRVTQRSIRDRNHSSDATSRTRARSE